MSFVEFSLTLIALAVLLWVQFCRQGHECFIKRPKGQQCAFEGLRIRVGQPTKLRIAPGKQTKTVKVCFRTRGSVNQNENISYFLVGGQFFCVFEQNRQFPVLNFGIAQSASEPLIYVPFSSFLIVLIWSIHGLNKCGNDILLEK